MKKLKSVWIALLLVVIATLGACAPKYSFVEEPSLRWDYSQYLGYSAYVDGVLRNDSGSDWDYVQIEFSIYDQNGRNLGTALDNANNISAGDTWQFEAFLFDAKNMPYSFKLKEVSAW